MRPSKGPSTRDTKAAGSAALGRFLLALLKIGIIGFGGGMAVIALMEQEFVRKRRLITLDEFVHGVGLGQILGPFSVNACIFLGCRLFGILGGLLSAAVFLTPSIILVIALSYLYFQYHSIPALQGVVAGLGPVVIALILSAGWSIGRKVVRTPLAAAIALAAAAAGVARVNTIWVLLAAGLAGFLLGHGEDGANSFPPERRAGAASALGLVPLCLISVGPLLGIVATFFKIGLVFFGGGFVLVPVLHHHLVTQLRWLRPQEFLDGVAISNLTPGPIAVLATFAGYRVGGIIGALAATAALFAPAVVLMVVLSRQYTRVRDDRRVKRFLSGVNPAVAGLIFSAVILLGPSALLSWQGVLLSAVSLFLLARLRWHPVFALGIGAACGYLGFCR